MRASPPNPKGLTSFVGGFAIVIVLLCAAALKGARSHARIERDVASKAMVNGGGGARGGDRDPGSGGDTPGSGAGGADGPGFESVALLTYDEARAALAEISAISARLRVRYRVERFAGPAARCPDPGALEPVRDWDAPAFRACDQLAAADKFGDRYRFDEITTWSGDGAFPPRSSERGLAFDGSQYLCFDRSAQYPSGRLSVRANAPEAAPDLEREALAWRWVTLGNGACAFVKELTPDGFCGARRDFGAEGERVVIRFDIAAPRTTKEARPTVACEIALVRRDGRWARERVDLWEAADASADHSVAIGTTSRCHIDFAPSRFRIEGCTIDHALVTLRSCNGGGAGEFGLWEKIRITVLNAETLDSEPEWRFCGDVGCEVIDELHGIRYREGERRITTRDGAIDVIEPLSGDVGANLDYWLAHRRPLEPVP